MINLILESNLTSELKDKMKNIFLVADQHMNEHAYETSNGSVIYLPVELTFNRKLNKVVRVGLVNDLYFENGKDLEKLEVEFEKEEFNQFNENGVIEDLIPMNLENENCIIAMPAIYNAKDKDGDGERVISLEYTWFFK